MSNLRGILCQAAILATKEAIRELENGMDAISGDDRRHSDDSLWFCSSIQPAENLQKQEP